VFEDHADQQRTSLKPKNQEAGCTPHKLLVFPAIAKTAGCRQAMCSAAVVTGLRAYPLLATEVAIADNQDSPVRSDQCPNCRRRCRMGRSYRNRNADRTGGNKLPDECAFRSHQGRDFLPAQGWCNAPSVTGRSGLARNSTSAPASLGCRAAHERGRGGHGTT